MSDPGWTGLLYSVVRWEILVFVGNGKFSPMFMWLMVRLVQRLSSAFSAATRWILL